MLPATGAQTAHASSPPGRQPTRLLAAVAVLAGLPGLYDGATHYAPFIADDALISLRYADRLVDGLGLTWTEGPRVEGYSNLLWVLLTALPHALGVDLIFAARALGVLSALGVLAALGALCARAPVALPARMVAAAALGALLAQTGPFCVWAIGGLEQPLLGLLLAVGIVMAAPLLQSPPTDAGAHRRAMWAGLPLALMCWTRPDAPLFVALLAGCLWLACWSRNGLRAGLWLSLWPACAVLLQLGFRLAYYDDWVPNTARIKAPLSTARVDGGWSYVEQGLSALWPLLLPGAAALVLVVARRLRPALPLSLLALSLAWTGYLVFIGGDIFPAHRHQWPNLVCWGLLGASGLPQLLDARARWVQALTLAACLYLPVATLELRRDDGKSGLAKRERWEWQGEVLGPLFRDGFAPARPRIAVTAAGAVPYFSGLPALDMLGLNDRHIARQPATPGGKVGHDHHDPAYVLAEAPELMTFGIPVGGHAPPDMAGLPGFAEGYRQVAFEGALPQRRQTSRTYVALRGAIGVQATAVGVRIPGYLLSGAVAERGFVGSGPVRHVDASAGPPDNPAPMVGRLAGQTATSPTVTLAPGHYRVRCEPACPWLGMRIARLEAGAVRVPNQPDAPSLVVDTAAKLRLSLVGTGVETWVRTLVVERLDTPIAGQLVDARTGHVLRRAPSRKRAQGRALRDLGRFDGDAEGWALGGFTLRPAPPAGEDRDRRMARIEGEAGGVLDSFDSAWGDRIEGIAEGPQFVVPDDAVLQLSVAGGQGQVGLRLWLGDRILRQWVGRDDERLRRVYFDLSPLAGQTVRLDAVDHERGGWGHIVLNEIWLRQRKR